MNVLNQSWPVFVFPDVYLDGRHVSGAKHIYGSGDQPDSVLLKIGLDGCNRLNALGGDLNLTVVMFIDNYPIHNITVPEHLYEAEITVDCFPTKEQAQYFYESICHEIT
ncbi:hypothetical protein [Marinobacter sp.]|uniref:hypothetical protein n=1 Tax=Marinobacter sp. TaxID=50741 RepID=UPI00384D9F71